MSALSINPSSTLLSASGGPAIGPLPAVRQPPGGGQVSGSNNPGDAEHISPGAQFLARLEQLKQSDPAKFKDVLTKVADQPSAAAQQQGVDTPEGQFLSQLAAKFKNVADGGDISQLLRAGPTGNRVEGAYGHANRSVQQALHDFVNKNKDAHRPVPDASTQKLISTIIEEINQATAPTATSSGSK
jgi:hypothetical protein